MHTDDQKWPLASEFVVLGHVLQDDGSIRRCWTRARAAMWRAFWANPATRESMHLNLHDRLGLLSKAVTPQLDFRCSRWPPQKQAAAELDNTKRKMTAILLRVSPYPDEAVEDFVRRRGRLSASVCNQQGLWSSHFFHRATKWDLHLSRDRNIQSWPCKLRLFRDRDWFMQRRIELAPNNGWSASCVAGKTDTRAFRGKVHTRWHDGIHFALSK